jgi:hypothetical protein
MAKASTSFNFGANAKKGKGRKPRAKKAAKGGKKGRSYASGGGGS